MALLGFNKSKVYLIGISDYVSPIKSLSTPVKDINAIEEALCDFDSVTKKADITSSDFETFLNEMVVEVNNSGTDRVLFYFAGHGTTINNTRGPQGYLILKNNPNDENSSNYKIEDLLTHFSKLTCKHLLIILDCCFAGAVQWDINKRAAGRKTEEKITDPLYRIFSGNNAWQIITSAAANQEALNSYNLPGKKLWGDGLRNEESDNSPFAIQFINALKGVGKEVFFSENIITANRLYTYISENLIKDLDEKDIDHEQVPGLFSLLNHKNGQFIFSFKNEEPVFAKTPEFENPYRGFDSYTEKDSEVFLGRDKLISDFKKDTVHFNNFFIAGPSGIGKSSLVKAGFVSYLLSQTNNTAFHLFRPTTFDFTGTETWKKKLCDPNGEKHILFFDQFEEAIGLDADKQKKLAEIIECGRSASTVFLFIAIRSDKSKRILENPIFNWGRFKTILVSFPGNTDIEDIIVKPALRHATVIRAAINKNKSEKEIDIKADDNFINSIIQDYKEPGSLPFLSTALHEWFKSVGQYDDPRLLKQDDWGKSGSIDEVFNAKMKRIEDGMEDKYVFRRLMFRLLDYFENSPVRKQLARKYTQPEDKALLKKLEDERIIRYPDDRAENDPERLIEFAHDSIIEKWLVHQEWFKERVDKARNNIPDLVRAQNHLVHDVMIWQQACEKKGFINKLKAKNELWNHEEELPKIKRDVQADDKNDSVWEHIKSTFWSASTLKIAPVTYFTPPEIDFIQRSVKRNKVGAKIIHRIWILITVMSAVALGLIYRGSLVAKRQANVNLARSYADKSSNVGETEALYLLKEAEKLNPNDPYIAAKFNELMNERDYVGNPFAIAVTNVEREVKNIYWDSLKHTIYLHSDFSDSIEWDYTGNNEPGKHINYSPLKIRDVKKDGNMLIIDHNIMDTITFSGQEITGFAVSRSGDSVYIVTQQDKKKSEYFSTIYCYSIEKQAKKLTIKKEVRINQVNAEFSPNNNYIYFNGTDGISFYTFAGDSVTTITYDVNGTTLDKIFFNDPEDKVLLGFIHPEQDHSSSVTLDIYDFKRGKGKNIYGFFRYANFNYLFKNDTAVIYFNETFDSLGRSIITYTDYNTERETKNNYTIFAPRGFYFANSLFAAQSTVGLFLFDALTKKIILANGLLNTPLDYEGEYIGREIIRNNSTTLLLIRSKKGNLYLYSLYNITLKPVLIHKSSFSLPMKKAFCSGNLSLLTLQFENNMLATFDLADIFKIKVNVGVKPSPYLGFIEISKDTFMLYSEWEIYPFSGNAPHQELDLKVIRRKGDYIFCDEYDSDGSDIENSTLMLNCKTGDETEITSDADKLKYLTWVSGLDFKQSDDTFFIQLLKRERILVCPDTGDITTRFFNGYLSGLLNFNNFFYRPHGFIEIYSYDLKLHTPEKDHVFNKGDSSDRYESFSDIDMPFDSVVTGVLEDNKSGKRKFFYWNINTDSKSFLDCPKNDSYFSIPKTSQILFSDNNRIVLYDFEKQDTLYTAVKKNTIANLFLLADGLRYLTVDGTGDLYSEFLPQKIKQVAYTIKSPNLAYLK